MIIGKFRGYVFLYNLCRSRYDRYTICRPFYVVRWPKTNLFVLQPPSHTEMIPKARPKPPSIFCFVRLTGATCRRRFYSVITRQNWTKIMLRHPNSKHLFPVLKVIHGFLSGWQQQIAEGGNSSSTGVTA